MVLTARYDISLSVVWVIEVDFFPKALPFSFPVTVQWSGIHFKTVTLFLLNKCWYNIRRFWTSVFFGDSKLPIVYTADFGSAGLLDWWIYRLGTSFDLTLIGWPQPPNQMLIRRVQQVHRSKRRSLNTPAPIFTQVAMYNLSAYKSSQCSVQRGNTELKASCTPVCLYDDSYSTLHHCRYDCAHSRKAAL